MVAIALLSSWLLAMAFIPVLTIWALKVKEGAKAEAFDSTFYRAYRAILGFGTLFHL